MTDLFDELFGLSRDERAAWLDGQAVADPTKPSSQETALCGLLTDILGYVPKRCAFRARKLLVECGNDYRGLRRMIVALRIEGKLDWVQRDGYNEYGLCSWLAAEHNRQKQAEEQRAWLETTGGRKAKYASHEGVLS